MDIYRYYIDIFLKVDHVNHVSQVYKLPFFYIQEPPQDSKTSKCPMILVTFVGLHRFFLGGVLYKVVWPPSFKLVYKA